MFFPGPPPGCSHRLPHSSSHTGLSKPMTFPVLPHPCNSPAHPLLLTRTRGSPPHHAPHCNYQITPARLTWRISGSLSLEETLCLERWRWEAVQGSLSSTRERMAGCWFAPRFSFSHPLTALGEVRALIKRFFTNFQSRICVINSAEDVIWWEHLREMMGTDTDHFSRDHWELGVASVAEL